MSFQSALTHLANLPVVGVPRHYAVNATPPTITRAHLPCLIVAPIDPRQDRFLRNNGAGFVASAFSNGSKSMTVQVSDLLLTTIAESKSALRAHLPALIDHIDNYCTALKSDVLLGGHLAQPTQFSIQIGIFEWEGKAFYGCSFQHQWVIEV
jgi:hypothetical protein